MKQIRESIFSKIIVHVLTILLFLQPMQIFALTSGPTQPEFNAFTPIGTSDMVDLGSGDFNYNIPIMDVGGYPLNLAYNSGLTMDQEASWTGLGWNLNVGQIERQVRGLPDDFRGDEMVYENNTRDNRTVGVNLGVNAAAFGWDSLPSLGLSAGLGIESNNYEGISFKPSFGTSFNLSDNISVGLNFSSSVDEGASVTPSVSISKKVKETDNSTYSVKNSISLGLSSRKGVENLNMSTSVSRTGHGIMFNDKHEAVGSLAKTNTQGAGNVGGSISFNNQSYTPSKRIGYENSSFNFNAAVGGEVFGIEGQAQVTGYGSYQSIRPEYKYRIEKAFGYENTDYKKSQSGILDFNRENERVVSERTTALPVTNYTYDTYNIDGQGVSGMFRPYRSKVSSLYNDYVADFGTGNNFGVEIGLGQLVHGSADFKTTPSYSHTGPWESNNNALNYFKEENTDSRSIDYEPCTFKLVGSKVIDPEKLYQNKFFGASAQKIKITGGSKNGGTSTSYGVNGIAGGQAISEIKRSKRFIRNQVIQKITYKEAAGDLLINTRPASENLAKPHHTAGIKVLQTNGSTYVYGQTAYNTKKVETTFDVSNKTGNNKNGLVNYNSLSNNSVNGESNSTDVSDEYLNKITTPGYAHSYMLSSVLSSDYADIDNNGLTPNDLGGYTKFEYTTTDNNYQWRIPFNANEATYNNGLFSKKNDQKANYIYGVKELVYLNKIVTKTHVAFLDLVDRQDAIGVNSEKGGAGAGRMKRLKSIRLYSLPEVTNSSGQIVDPGVNNIIKPIKTAYFEYDYSLCPNMPNNSGSAELINGFDINASKGKLTLKKVYFTYRGSNMGKYTPYAFEYSVKNPLYDNKGFDIWGNYKFNDGTGEVNSGTPTTTEYAYVQQLNASNNAKTDADINTSAWTLQTIKLPSGGEIKVETESDDYQFVQNKKAMQMFQVIGAGDANAVNINYNELYSGNDHAEFIYVKLSQSQIAMSPQEFINKYLGENLEKAIQFRFLLNMRDNDWQKDYVQGYFEIDQRKKNQIRVVSSPAQGTVAILPLNMLRRGGGTGAARSVNPIAKAGWGFGRTYLNRVVYGMNDEPTETDFETIVYSLLGSIGAISEIFKGPNKALQDNGCARYFNPGKSWIRLENPDGKKIGGGLRIKSIKLSDQWTSMVASNGGTDLTDMEYGQVYSYDDSNGKSSGVATFEPNSSSENPFVEPLYNSEGSFAENIAAPMESNYVEKPFGENFFPSPKVTYKRVAVKNLPRKNTTDNIIINKHATGEVVTEHYTSYDFPTKVDYTSPDVIPDITPNNIIANLLLNDNISVRNHLTMSQGFAIETNDMNGKTKSQKIYAEGRKGEDILSSVEYVYNIDKNGNVDSNLTTIDGKGVVSKNLIGLDYDMINDFNQSFSSTESSGVDANLAAFLIPTPILIPIPIFIPTVFQKTSYHENLLRTAVTTKHVHKTGILVETIAKDLGAKVSTKNLAWDAESGEVLLTQTENEYNDNYYSFTYPAYWMYDGMGAAYKNIDIEGTLQANAQATTPTSSSNATDNPYFNLVGYSGTDLTKIFHLGDELYTSKTGGVTQSTDIVGDAVYKVWVVGFNENKTGVLLMDRNGNYINKCQNNDSFSFKIVRSGYRNLLTASMASVTSMINPIKITNIATGEGTLDQNSFTFNGAPAFNPRIINASAVLYKDFWNTQIESNLPYYPDYISSNDTNITTNPITQNGDPVYPYDLKVNPFLWNIKGNWRAEKSFAYLTGRNNAASGVVNNPRNEGFLNKFSPFYNYTNGIWNANTTGWTSASSVTKHSPYGAELENKDALNRYSTAQYGYRYTLPMAVASNSKYQQMGFEGFEEAKTNTADKHFAFNQGNLNQSQSHTGKYSLKVNKGQSAYLLKLLKPTVRTITAATCPTGGGDDGGGDDGGGGCDGQGGSYENVWVCVKWGEGHDCGDKSYCCEESQLEYVCVPAGSNIVKNDTIFISKKGIPTKMKSKWKK